MKNLTPRRFFAGRAIGTLIVLAALFLYFLLFH
jgi:hypothetical protein